MEQSAILQLEGVTKAFGLSSPPAVTDMSFTLTSGEILGILGPSGCGKTTLLRLIAGFEVPQAGTIAIAAYPVAGGGVWIPPEKRDIGIVFQDYALFPHLNVADNISFGLRQKRLKSSISIAERTHEVLALVGLEGLQKRYPHELSGGQQQRVALARALAPQPSLILLDEPLSNLDVQVRLRLREEIRTILKASGISAIFVTHDQEEALCISDWVAVMRQGYLEQFGTPETIYRQPKTRFVAEFVTQANFIPARRKGQGWDTELGYFESDKTLTIDQGEIAIAEEDIHLKLNEGKADQSGVAIVRDRQFLGREYRYRLLTPSGQEIKAVAPISQAFAINSQVKITLANSPIGVFPSSLDQTRISAHHQAMI